MTRNFATHPLTAEEYRTGKSGARRRWFLSLCVALLVIGASISKIREVWLATHEVPQVEKDNPGVKEACLKGNAAECTHLGNLYQEASGGRGDLPDTNWQKVLGYYKMGCEGGDPAGCDRAGQLYVWQPVGIEPVVTEGFESEEKKLSLQANALFKRACDQGYAPGCKDLHADAGGSP